MMGMTSFSERLRSKRITFLKLKSSILMVSEIDVWRGLCLYSLSVIKIIVIIDDPCQAYVSNFSSNC